MTTGLFYDDIFLEHNPGPTHPENAKRLQAIKNRLELECIWKKIYRPITCRCSLDFLERNHSKQHIQRIFASCKSAPSSLDPDTVVSAHSCEAALTAVGAAIEATNSVMAGELQNAFCAVRPPGHHAEKDRAMGFCLVNNIALAAYNLLDQHHLERILIIDWDVHHGNGTQQAFYETSRVFFLSFHQSPLYPGTGYPGETGAGKGAGFNRNVPIAPGTPAEAYLENFKSVTKEVFYRFQPQFVLISAGFDAHLDDALAQLRLTEKEYALMTEHIMSLAQKFSQGRITSLLEGGYNLQALSNSVFAHVSTLMNSHNF